jgi:hypothetical protein
MPAFDGRTFEGTNGAVLYLQKPAGRSTRLTLSSGVVSSDKGSRALVVCHNVQSQSFDSALDESIRVAQEALDIWAVKGAMARTLADVADEHIVWWEDTNGLLACRIWATARFSMAFEGRAVVRDKEGNVIPPAPEPVLVWHPSFRFFRLGQASDDLVDAFRNYYLALEAILSTIEPVRLRQNGRPAERESEWLDRALRTAAGIVDLTDYAVPGAGEDPIDAVRAEIYTGARTQTFHAKTGAAVLLPHDDATRSALRDSVTRLRRFYLDLAQSFLGFRFLGRGGLAQAGFQAMASGVAPQQLYASSDTVDPTAAEAGDLPATLTTFDATHAAQFDDEYHIAYSGMLHPRDLPSDAVRQVGAIRDDRALMYEDLEGELHIHGLDYVEVVIAVAAQDPRALGTRYLS